MKYFFRLTLFITIIFFIACSDKSNKSYKKGKYYGDLRRIASNVYPSSEQIPNLAGYAFDGDMFTRWSSNFNDNEWISIDLNAVCCIDKIKLFWETAYAEKYKILYSVDNKNWKTLVNVDDGQGKQETINIKTPVYAKYIKLETMKRATEWGNSLYEFEIYGYSDKPLPENGGLINYDLKRSLSPYEQKVKLIHTQLIKESQNDPASSLLNDTQFLRLIQKRAFDYFWYESIEGSGLIPDKAYNFRPSWSPHTASVACAGYFLTGIPIAIENKWITKDEGYKKTLELLKYYYDNLENQKGFYYHFINPSTGKRSGNCELSSIDSTLFFMGLITSIEYFKGTDIEKLGWLIYDRADWNWMLAGKNTLSMGWFPNKGFIEYTWGGMSEGIMAYVLAIGSRTHPVPADTWKNLNRPVGEYKGYKYFVEPAFQSIFRYQYPFLWMDCKDRNDGYGNYYESAVNAVLACRQYCIEMKEYYPAYSGLTWGLGAADNTNNVYKIFGFPPGSPKAPADGTIVPYAIGGSVFLTPYISIKSLRYMYDNFRYAWGKYGFADSILPSAKKKSMSVLGLDQGTILLGIENYLTGLPQKLFMQNESVKKAFTLMGFKDEPQKNAKQKPLDLSGEWKFTKGFSSQYIKPDFDDSKWNTIFVPDRWENQDYIFDGKSCYRKSFNLTKKQINLWKDVYLSIGGIDDEDTVFINGTKIGSSSGYLTKRKYFISKKLLNEGSNIIAIEVYDKNGYGGIWLRPVEIGPYFSHSWSPIDNKKTLLKSRTIFK